MITARSVTLRRATPDDEGRLLTWANDPTTRANALSTDRISEAEHRKWFTKTLNSDERWQYIAIEGGTPVGQIRFDRTAEAWEVDVSVAPSERGRGLGTAIIQAGVHRFHNDEPNADRLRALVRPNNAASLAAFERAGFTHSETTERTDVPVVVLEQQLRPVTTRNGD